MAIRVEQVDKLSRIDRQQWQQLNTANNPFLHYDFLRGLEEHHCLDEHGWQPCHLTFKSADTLLAVLPLYYRHDSYGEFVFDWSWADAYERAGGRYYPKLVSAIPFTPVCGPRLLLADHCQRKQAVRNTMLAAIRQILQAGDLSSWHCLFTAPADQASFRQQNVPLRKTIQFHWHNRSFTSFDDFLNSLTAKRRKQIRRERRRIDEQNIHIERLMGADISERQWAIFYEFYCATFYRRWGRPRLTLDFFKSLSDNLPEHTLLILAKQQTAYIAGAFSMLDDDTLYGRHWGCNRQVDNLHFELCYYQTIEYCIEQGLSRMDAGIQGEHKIKRGFQPVATVSGHLIMHPTFDRAIRNFLREEEQDIDRYLAAMQAHSPYKTQADQP